MTFIPRVMLMRLKYGLVRFGCCVLYNCKISRQISVVNYRTAQVNQKQSELFNILSQMPKEKKATSELRQMRLKAKSATNQVVPSTIQLYVLGNGSIGCPRCLYLLTSHGRYIFNCGEGTQRLANEHKLKLSKLEHIFITHRSWKNLGGLPGMSLTVQDIGVPSLTLHGPPGLVEIFEMMKVFIDMKDLEVVQRNYTEKPFVDNCMEIVYVPLFSKKSKEPFQHVGLTNDKYVCRNSVLESDNTSQEGARKRYKVAHMEDNEENVSIAYICKCHNKPGQLLLEKCVEQGVPPGPLLGLLKAGQDVTLSNGHVVRSQDVVAPEEPGPIFIVLECPSVDYIDALLTEKKFDTYQANNSCQNEHAIVVIHFSEKDVMSDARYRQWMNRFPPSTFHLVLNSSNASISTTAVHQIQHMFHLIHPQVFPLLKEDNIEAAPEEMATIFNADNMTSFGLRPKTGLDRNTAVKLDAESYVEEAFTKPDFSDNLQLLKEYLATQRNGTSSKDNFSANYPEIAFLGTGSCIPSKVRNVSGILVNISLDTCLLLDCGEGTYSQLYRLYGTIELKNVFRRISCIFISHLHADHHLGLIQLLEARKAVLPDDQATLLILAPFRVIQWLRSYDQNFNNLLHNIRLIPNVQLNYENNKMENEDYKELLTKTDLKQISTVPVKHCKDAHGLVFTTKEEYKVVYSGDTMPCEALVSAGQNCSLLIHEATMEDDLEEEAVLKTHSTVSQAIEIGEKMCAGFTILTHFSQRYAKLPLFPKKYSDRIGFAFDNMVVRPSDLHLLPHFLPSLKSLFAEHYEEMKEKTAKRLRQKQLLEEAMQQTSESR